MLSPTVPLTPDKLTIYMRAALLTLGHPLAKSVTLHSLRRSGARAAAGGGASEDAQVMSHGTWTSAAVYAYVPKKLFSKVPHVLAKLLGHS